MSPSENSRFFPVEDKEVSVAWKPKQWPPVRTFEVDPDEETKVVAMRTAKLVGKTVTGTLFMTGNNRIKYWVKWNHRKCDNIYVPADVAVKCLGENPVAGTKIQCTITELGPDTATAWRKHPQCLELKLATTFSRKLFNKTILSDKQRTRRPRFVNSKSPTSSGAGSWRSRSQSPKPSAFFSISGSPASAAMDVGRSVLRRAERQAVGLQDAGLLDGEELVRFLNRAGDLAFVLARHLDRHLPYNRVGR